MRYRFLGAAVLSTLACCGGSDSDGGDSPGPAPPPATTQRTDDGFVRSLDALCKETNPKLAAIRAALTNARDAARAGRASLPKTLETFAALLRRAGAETRRFRVRLHAVTVPRSEAAFHRTLLAAVDEGLANLRRQVSAAKARDAVRLRELSVEGSVLNAKARGLFAGHGGFRSCGRR